ncbi:MAG: family acetyltransferase [Frankiales bacterium]|nr:family acetyltransferase [Frankiales bacterium]
MRTPEPVVLTGGGVTLEPLALAHVPDLLVAGADADVWRWLPAAPPRSLVEMTSLVEQAVADPARLAWAVVVDGRAVGSTSYLDVDPELGGLEVGWTWYSPAHWRTSVNPACKHLLLGHAFDDLGAGRVLLKTDALNARSRSAIGRLGAQYDGTLRHHRLRPDGTVRDTAYFSLLAAEWPQIRAGLDERLGPQKTR